MLSGYKTYIFGALIMISAILYAFKVIDIKTLQILMGIFGGGSALSLRSAVKNGNKKVASTETNT